MTTFTRNAKRTLGLGALMLVGATAVPSFASEFEGGYVGGALGGGRDKIHGPVSVGQKDAAAGGVEAGYGWDNGPALLGLDVFYNQVQSKDRTDSTNTSVKVGDRTYGGDVRLGYPLDKWLPYVKLGIGRVDGTDDASSYGKNGNHVGIGVDYKIADHWAIGSELVHITGKEQNGAKMTSDALFFTAKYYFADRPVAAAPVAEAPPPAATPMPEAKPAPKMEKYTLSSTELFGFDSDKLSMPQPKLDEIATALNNQKDISDIDITGYADRVGPAKYNQKLSERRANAVKAYLVSKGVAESRLKAIGKGQADPVVDCKKTKRGELIKCLEPNRRVVVEEFSVQRRTQ